MHRMHLSQQLGVIECRFKQKLESGEGGIQRNR
jgi:hypothetical protein